ncbi:MAG: hypothetical protein KJ069_05585 [Anaerolineae bacterium]|nr:hypothetical protein [Anaerolineae bacterium]
MKTTLRVIIGIVAGTGFGLVLSSGIASFLSALFGGFLPPTWLIPILATLTAFTICALLLIIALKIVPEFTGFNIGTKIVILGGAGLGAVNAFVISGLFTLGLLAVMEETPSIDMNTVHFTGTLFAVVISSMISGTLLGGIVGGLIGFHYGHGRDAAPERSEAFDAFLKRRS